MKKFLSMLLAVVMVLALTMPALAETKANRGDLKINRAQPEQQAQANTAKLRGATSWDFETDPAEAGFTFLDQDGDGFNWAWHVNTGTGNYTTHGGDGVMTSASYDNDNEAALTPDNWMVSPVCEGSLLTFWMCGQDASYCEEYVGVYVSTDGGETWSNEIAGFTATGEMTQQAVNLSAYSGEIRFALRHYNCTDMFYLNIDDIELMSEIPQCTVTFVDGVDESVLDTMTVEAGTVLDERDFPTPPTHEGYEFTGWDYNGASIAANTTITANYKQEGSNTWDFETDPTAQGFTFLDQDGDGNGWGSLSNAQYAHESTCCMASASYGSSGALTPDNWMITPAFKGTRMTFWVCGLGYPDHIGLFVSTDGGTTWSDKPILEYDTDGTSYVKQVVDLTAYEGEIKVAFRHYNCTDQYYVFIDDIETTMSTEVPQYTVTFVDGMDDAVLGTITVNEGYVLVEGDFPETPEHEGYVFYAWDYDGNGIGEDTTITAYYAYDGVYSDTVWDFESNPYLQGFTTDDQDGDGDDWGWIDNSSYANSTSHSMASLSNEAAPDNWLITPKFTGTVLSFYTRDYSSSYTDHLGVYVSTDLGENWTLLQELDVNNSAYRKYSVDLSAYKGETLKVAFRHFNSDGQGYAFIDDIEVKSESATYTVTFVDGCDGTTLSTLQVNEGYVLVERDFPTPPTHEDYEFTGWDYDGSGINADTTVTAVYSFASVYSDTIWDFETDPSAQGFMMLDQDGDGHNWEWREPGASYVHSTSHAMYSASWESGNGSFIPENWLITPKFTASMLTFWARNYSGNYLDHLEVYVSTDNGATWSDSVLSIDPPNAYTQYAVDLTSYGDAELRVAFVHCNSNNMYYLLVDDIEIVTLAPTAVVTFVDGFDNSVISTLEVNSGYILADADYPAAPEHEDWTFTGWDYNGRAILGDITVTAQYSYDKLLIWDFETSPTEQGFLMLDKDGDSKTWQWTTSGSYNHHEGSGYMQDTYRSTAGMDDWLITPTFMIDAESGSIGFFANCNSTSYHETIGVYVSTDGGETWSDELYQLTTNGNTPTEYTVDLSAYAGQPIKVGFRHYNSVDQYYAILDYITVMDGVLVTGEYEVTFVDGLTGEPIDTLTVEEGTVLTEADFPTPPEHENWTFRNWDYDGAAIHSNITVTANYGYDKLLIWDFETDPAEQGFEMIDKDGDNKTWTWIHPDSSTTNHYEGTGYMRDSFKSGNDMDDWLITPFFKIDAESGSMSFWANCTYASYNETIGVYVSTDGGETWSEELFVLTTEGNAPTEYTVDLSAYAGQVIRVGFRHYNSDDQYYAILDYITIVDGVQVYPHNVEFKVGNATLATLRNVTEITEADLPEGANWYGYQFTGWDKTVEEINEALKEGDVTVNGKFVPLENTIHLTIVYGDEVTEKDYTESRWVTVKAKPQNKAGQYFAYWTLDGTIISYSPRANVRVVSTCTLEAHYMDEPTEATGVAQLVKATFAGSRLTFVCYMAQPDGATLADAGLLAAPGTEFDPETAELTTENAKFYKHCSITDPTQPASYTWIKTNVAEGDVWYVRVFVTYELDGETVTVFGETIGVKAGNDYYCSDAD